MVFVFAIINILKLYKKKISSCVWDEISKNQHFMIMVTQDDISNDLKEILDLSNEMSKSEYYYSKVIEDRSKNFNKKQLKRLDKNLNNSKIFIRKREDDNNIRVYKYLNSSSQSVSLYLPYYFKEDLLIESINEFKHNIFVGLRREFYITNICFVNIEDEMENGSLKIVKHERNSSSVSDSSESFIFVKQFFTTEEYLDIEELLDYTENPIKYYNRRLLMYRCLNFAVTNNYLNFNEESDSL